MPPPSGFVLVMVPLFSIEPLTVPVLTIAMAPVLLLLFNLPALTMSPLIVAALTVMSDAPSPEPFSTVMVPLLVMPPEVALFTKMPPPVILPPAALVIELTLVPVPLTRMAWPVTVIAPLLVIPPVTVLPPVTAMPVLAVIVPALLMPPAESRPVDFDRGGGRGDCAFIVNQDAAVRG